MIRHPKLALALSAISMLALAGLGPAIVHAGLGDKLKKKVDQAAKSAEAEVDQATGKSDAAKPAAGATEDEGSTGEPAAKGGGTVGSVSTKFDFVPGEKVLFADDFTQDELGEFPARWTLGQGTFEVAEMKGERWLRCTSEDGRIRMKLPATPPERWTLEFDFYVPEATSMALNVFGVNDKDGHTFEMNFPHGEKNVVFRSGAVYSATPIAGAASGRHHVMLLARGPALKIYVDRERVSNAPDVTTAAGLPREFEWRLWARSGPMITNVRFAEGPAPAADLLAGGKLVTHGIRFATGSDVVEPESAPILRQVAAWMTANPNAKLSVTGHTDNVGSAPANLDLSKRRAAAVARVLGAEFSIAADRLTPDGKGDTAPMASNTSTEGRAMNRRVEFAKL